MIWPIMIFHSMMFTKGYRHDGTNGVIFADVQCTDSRRCFGIRAARCAPKSATKSLKVAQVPVMADPKSDGSVPEF